MFLIEKFGKRLLPLLTLKGVLMNRRKFISFSLISMATVPLLSEQINSHTWREYKSDKVEDRDTYDVSRVSNAIKKMYPTQKIIKESQDISLSGPAGICGDNFPIYIKSKLNIKKITMFMSCTPSILLGVLDIPKDTIIDYKFRATAYREGYLVILSETQDNKIYENSTWVDGISLKVCT